MFVVYRKKCCRSFDDFVLTSRFGRFSWHTNKIDWHILKWQFECVYKLNAFTSTLKPWKISQNNKLNVGVKFQHVLLHIYRFVFVYKWIWSVDECLLVLMLERSYCLQIILTKCGKCDIEHGKKIVCRMSYLRLSINYLLSGVYGILFNVSNGLCDVDVCVQYKLHSLSPSIWFRH